MSGRFEVVVAYANGTVGSAAGANALVDQFNADKGGFVLVNQGLQTGATVANVLSIVTTSTAFIPFLNAATNTVAGTTTFLKIVAQYKGWTEGEEPRSFQKGDVISLVGNVAGVVAAFAALAGAPFVASVFTAVAVGAAVAGLVTSAAAQKIHDSVLLPLWEQHFRDTPDATYPDHWVSPDMRLVPRAIIDTDHAGMIAQIRLDPATDDISIASTPADLTGAAVGSGGGAASGSSEGSDPAIVVPVPQGGAAAGGAIDPVESGGLSVGEVGIVNGSGNSNGGSVATVPSQPGAPSTGENTPVGHDEIQISIESINGDPSLGHPPLPPEPTPPHVPHPAPPVEAQDSYGCCTNSQDTYA